MQEIANGTFNYATLSEIMPMIYKRFTEKSAEEWRQIYKALQLLEFLIKNGSERVIDDARSHLSLLKMLRQFHYIDMNGKDQGINVRNRAKELSDLLGDVERIRAERKKARHTRGKYGGVEGGAGLGGSSSGRYGGYGSEAGSGTYGGYSGGVYGDGGGFGGNAADDYEGTQSRRDRFEEYDEYDEGSAAAAPSRRKTETQSTAASKVSKAAATKPQEPEVDLFDFGGDEPAPAPPAKQPASLSDDFGGFSSAAPAAADDDFDDFVSATPSSAAPPTKSTTFNAPSSQFGAPSGQTTNNLFASTISPPPSSTATPSAPNYSAFSAPKPQQPIQPAATSFHQQSPRPTNYQASQPNYFGSIQAAGPPPSSTTTKNGGLSSPPISKAGAGSKSAGGDPFASLNLGSSKKAANSTSKGPTMADMAREKSSANIWGPSANSSRQQQPASSGGNGDDLLGL